jgi:hypothetical protein
MNLSYRWLLVLGVCLQSLSACGGPLAVGDAVPAFAAKDQHGNNDMTLRSVAM